MGLVWDAIRESSSSPKDKFIAVGAALVMAAIFGAVCLWAGKGCFHVASEFGSVDSVHVNRDIGGSTIVLWSITGLSGAATAGFVVLAIVMLLGRHKKPQSEA